MDYQTSLKNTLYLLEKLNPQNILIRGVDDNWPVDERRKWFEFWQVRGTLLEYLPPISRCGSIRKLLPKDSGENGTTRLYGCYFNRPLFEMVILFDGRAVMCCQDMGRELIWGDD